ncbi:MAG: CDP-alcohol phosphatidyltransferase family protein [Bryobacter sp.]|nr:CDP-alcohol phosphatidyltransferase family protein [Bryobacter sp.]
MLPFLLRQTPNALSLARLLAAPAVAYLISTHHPAAWPAFVAGALSDAADGWLARRLHVTSNLGLYLDPLADKTFVTLTTIAWALAGQLPYWLLALILGRDLFILLGSALIYTVKRRKDFAPTPAGKISTILQMLALGACFWFTGFWLNFFLALTTLGTLVSLLDYARLGWQKWNAA